MNTTLSMVLAAMTVTMTAACSSEAPGQGSTDTKSDTVSGTEPAKGSSGGATSDPSAGSSGSTSSGGGDVVVKPAGAGACTSASEVAVVSKSGFADTVANCAQTNLGAEPGTKTCIKALGLSDGCTTCFDDDISCVIANCLSECMSDSNSAACTSCRGAKCDAAFLTCSGLPAQ